MPGARELCALLDGVGVPRGLITRNVKRSVSHFHAHIHSKMGLSPFEPAVSRECGFAYKPSPEVSVWCCVVNGCLCWCRTSSWKILCVAITSSGQTHCVTHVTRSFAMLHSCILHLASVLGSTLRIERCAACCDYHAGAAPHLHHLGSATQ